MECVVQVVVHRGQAVAVHLEPGEQIKIITPDGGQVADATFAGFHQALTRRINGTRRRGRPSVMDRAVAGTVFYDGNPAPVLELVTDHSAAGHDLLFPGCQSTRPADPPGCRDLLSRVLDLPLSHLPAVCSFFMDVDQGDSVPSRSRPGDHVVLVAHRAVTLGITACPGPTSSSRPGVIHVEVYRG